MSEGWGDQRPVPSCQHGQRWRSRLPHTDKRHHTTGHGHEKHCRRKNDDDISDKCGGVPCPPCHFSGSTSIDWNETSCVSCVLRETTKLVGVCSSVQKFIYDCCLAKKLKAITRRTRTALSHSQRKSPKDEVVVLGICLESIFVKGTRRKGRVAGDFLLFGLESLKKTRDAFLLWTPLELHVCGLSTCSFTVSVCLTFVFFRRPSSCADHKAT